jgi:hypothetical protein
VAMQLYLCHKNVFGCMSTNRGNNASLACPP